MLISTTSTEIFLTATGIFLRSSAEIERHYKDVLKGAYKDYRILNPEFVSLRSIGAGEVVILDAHWEVSRVDATGAVVEVLTKPNGTFVLVKNAEEWYLSAVRVMIPVMDPPNFR